MFAQMDGRILNILIKKIHGPYIMEYKSKRKRGAVTKLSQYYAESAVTEYVLRTMRNSHLKATRSSFRDREASHRRDLCVTCS